jgi:hypothetical protein
VSVPFLGIGRDAGVRSSHVGRSVNPPQNLRAHGLVCALVFARHFFPHKPKAERSPPISLSLSLLQKRIKPANDRLRMCTDHGQLCRRER